MQSLPFHTPLRVLLQSKTDLVNETLLSLRNNATAADQINLFLKQFNLPALSFVEHRGAHAVILKTNDNRIVRISSIKNSEKYFREKYRLDKPQILQSLPRAKTVIDGFQVELLPNVRTIPEVDITFEHVKLLVAALYKEGCFFWDIKPQNIGLLNNGMPVVLDGGAVVHISKSAVNMQPFLHDYGLLVKEYWNQEPYAQAFKNLPHDQFSERHAIITAQSNGCSYTSKDWEKAQHAHVLALSIDAHYDLGSGRHA